jgi:hypothetical protein
MSTEPDDEDLDTLVSTYSSRSDQPPLVIELSVELPETKEVADPAEQVIEALSQSLRALGWKPTVLCAKRPGRPDGSGESYR